ncbi:hypothetical protein D3C78_1986020 [compost metagenome]
MDPAASGTERDQRQIKFRRDHLIFRRPGFRQNTAIGVEDHRIAGANFVVIAAHTIAEQNKKAIVMSASR